MAIKNLMKSNQHVYLITEQQNDTYQALNLAQQCQYHPEKRTVFNEALKTYQGFNTTDRFWMPEF